jgi:hypothetical protein
LHLTRISMRSKPCTAWVTAGWPIDAPLSR